jgi:spore germination protein (amino acid permease)
MERNKNYITHIQLFFFVVQTQVGIGILSLPRDLHQYAKADSWISVLAAGLGSQLFIFIMYFLCKQFPYLNLYEFTSKIVGKWIGNFFNVLFVGYYLLISSLIIILYTSILKNWIYPTTPVWVMNLLGIFTILYFASQSFKIIARFYTFVSIFLIILLGLVIFSFTNVDFRYLFPVGQAGLKNIILGANQGIIAMLGFDVILVTYSLVKSESKKIIKSISLANAFVTFYYLFIVMLAVITFSPKAMTLIPQPVLYMLKAIKFSVIERIDIVFLSVWVVSVATSLTTYSYLAAKGLSHFFKKPHQRMVPFVAVIVFVISLIPQKPSAIEAFGEFIGEVSYLFIGGIPFLLLIITLFLRKKLGELQHE